MAGEKESSTPFSNYAPGGDSAPRPGSLGGELGVTGINQFSGYILEEKLKQLSGPRGMETFREMSDNDALVGAICFLFEMILRKVDWTMRPASEDPAAVEVAEFVDSCRIDMEHSWESLISEILSMIPFGWSSHELCYKRRLGPDQVDPLSRSQYNDGMIGWQKIPIRAQETLNRWSFNPDGTYNGWWQWPPQGGAEIYLPMEKLLHFRTTSKKNNPEGRSLLRNAFTSWFRKKEMERIEAIGAERDLAGFPMMYVPPEILDPKAPPEVKAVRAAYEKILKNLRNDEQTSLILPAVFDANKNRLVEFMLMGTGSRRLIDTGAVIQRYDRAMAMSVLADVILLGHEKVGSFALASSKTDLLVYGMVALLDEIQSVFNRFGIPRLLRVNAIDPSLQPTLEHGDLEKDDVAVIAPAVAQLIAAGGIIPGGEEDENFLRKLVGMPPALTSQLAKFLARKKKKK